MKTFKQYTKVRPVYHKHFIGKLKNQSEKTIKYHKHFIGKLNRTSKIKKIDEGIRRLASHRDKVQDKLHDELVARHDHSKMTDEQHEAFINYTNDSDLVNHPLYSHGEKHDHSTDKHISAVVQKHKLHRNMTVYSGMRSPTHHPVENGHRHLHLPAYTSTSLSPDIASEFAQSEKNNKHTHTYWSQNNKKSAHKENEKFDSKNPEHVKSKTEEDKRNDRNGRWIQYRHMAAIKVPKGSHGYYIGNNHDSNTITDHVESEHLLHKGAKVKLKEHPEIDHDRTIVIHHGVLTHDGVKPTRHDK